MSTLRFSLGLLLLLAATVFSAGPEKPMHPPVVRLDGDGVAVGMGAANVSLAMTCGKCHDVEFIRTHDSHAGKGLAMDCLTCHTASGALSSDPDKAASQIRAPASEQCGACHGLVHQGTAPLRIPANLTTETRTTETRSPLLPALTLRAGTIFSAQVPARSALNLHKKERLQAPWDVHAARLLSCSDCHPTANQAKAGGATTGNLSHLVSDPRRISSAAEQLRHPDHRLASNDCRVCHDPFAVHRNLPYKRRHMETLTCQACHVPEIYGPALGTIDRTVVLPDGGPRLHFRGAAAGKPSGNLNTLFLEPSVPPLAPIESRGKRRIAPVNPVMEWRWVSGGDGRPVAEAMVSGALMENGEFRPETVLQLDRDGNGSLGEEEICLDTPDKVNWMAAQLQNLGVDSPRLQAELRLFPISHGVVAPAGKMDCAACHSRNSRLRGDALLSPCGPAVPDGFSVIPPAIRTFTGLVERDEAGRWLWTHRNEGRSLYILGLSRQQTSDLVGLILLLLTLAGVAIHAVLRRWRATEHPGVLEPVYIYPLYERIWHWTMALAVVVLAISGIEIHWAGGLRLFGLETAVFLHNLLAAILVANAALSLFYHVATGEIRQFFVFSRRFFHEAVLQLHFYLRGIFRHAPHPFEKTPKRKFNPLQQLTYVILLNLLLPFQIVTGILMWTVDRWPKLAGLFGGLAGVSPWHNVGAWLLVCFFTVHIYLITTGRTPLAGLRAMITGYEETPAGMSEAERQALVQMPLFDLVVALVRRSRRPVDDSGESK